MCCSGWPTWKNLEHWFFICRAVLTQYLQCEILLQQIGTNVQGQQNYFNFWNCLSSAIICIWKSLTERSLVMCLRCCICFSWEHELGTTDSSHWHLLITQDNDGSGLGQITCVCVVPRGVDKFFSVTVNVFTAGLAFSLVLHTRFQAVHVEVPCSFRSWKA